MKMISRLREISQNSSKLLVSSASTLQIVISNGRLYLTGRTNLTDRPNNPIRSQDVRFVSIQWNTSLFVAFLVWVNARTSCIINNFFSTKNTLCALCKYYDTVGTVYSATVLCAVGCTCASLTSLYL
jgi:hypothetical protein